MLPLPPPQSFWMVAQLLAIPTICAFVPSATTPFSRIHYDRRHRERQQLGYQYDGISQYVLSKTTEVCPSRSSVWIASQKVDTIEDEFDGLKVDQLKDLCRERGLKVSGKKSELQERLRDHHDSSAVSSGDADDLLSTTVSDDCMEEEPKIENEPSKPSEPTNFDALGLRPELLSSIESQGWEIPSPIQHLAIPAILSVHDEGTEQDYYTNEEKFRTSVWAEAPTGSGKTAAFVLPLVQLIMEEKRRERVMKPASASTTDDGGDTEGSINALILSPTRELAMQIGGVIEEIIEGMPILSHKKKNHFFGEIDVVTITGGVPIEPQIEELTARKKEGRNVDILVATPGRLCDVLLNSKRGNAQEVELEKKLLKALDSMGGKDSSLSLAQIEELKINDSIASGDDGGRSAIQDMAKNIQYLVVDEADRLLSQGFREEMDALLKLLPRSTRSGEQSTAQIHKLKTMLFSATFPEHIQPRVEQVLQRLSGKNSPPPLRLSCSVAGAAIVGPEEKLSGRQRKRLEQTTQPSAVFQGPPSTIKLRAIRLEEKDRTQVLRRLINEYGKKEWDRVLVFVATRYASEHVARKLRRAKIVASELHGKLDQDARIRRLEDFKLGKIRVLVATDLASRGLDVVGLPAVVNYDLPRSTADFTHRNGRTGRAGKEGTAISFITPTNEAHFDLIEQRYLQSKNVKREVLEGFEPDEAKWSVQSTAAKINVQGVQHSTQGLAHDKMFGGVKGRRKSKKDRLREKAAREQMNKN